MEIASNAKARALKICTFTFPRMNGMEERFRYQLDRRAADGTLRSLRHGLAVDGGGRKPPERNSPRTSPAIDFASNDYLGLARCPHQLRVVEKSFASRVAKLAASGSPLLGSTGSRLLSGDTSFAASLEVDLAKAHNRPAALLFNSGYDANLSVLGCSLMPGDVVVMDELCHNSLIMGVRMSRLTCEDGAGGNVKMFRHNNVDSLAEVMNDIVNPERNGPTLGKDGKILIVVESVYSMDGDVAPLERILDIAATQGASVVVDEAHGLGIYGTTNADDLVLGSIGRAEGKSQASTCTCSGGGTGVLAALNLEHHPALLCSVHTFGKAAGCHGAVVAASRTTVDYLINYGRPFVYSTSPPPHALVTIRCAYEAMMGPIGEERRRKVFRLVNLFRLSLDDKAKHLGLQAALGHSSLLLPSPSPIQAVLIQGNRQCIELCARLHSSNFDVYPIRSPTVPKGQERVRIIIHSHNTEEEVERLVDVLTREMLSMTMRSKM